MRKNKLRKEKIQKMQYSINLHFSKKVFASFQIYLGVQNDKKNELQKAENIYLECLKKRSINAILIYLTKYREKIKAFHITKAALNFSKLKKLLILMYKNALPRILKKRNVLKLLTIKNKLKKEIYFAKFQLETKILNKIDSKKNQTSRFKDILRKKKFMNKSLLYIKNKKMFTDLISIAQNNYYTNLLKLSFHGFKLCKLHQIRRDQILLDLLLSKQIEIKNNVFQTLKLISQKKRFLKIQKEILIKKVSQNLQKKMLKCFEKGYNKKAKKKELLLKADKYILIRSYSVTLQLKVVQSWINYSKNKILRRKIENDIIENRISQNRKKYFQKMYQMIQVIKKKKQKCKINYSKNKISNEANIKKRCMKSFKENHIQCKNKESFCSRTNMQQILKKCFNIWNMKYQHSKGLKERLELYIKNKNIKEEKLFIHHLKLNLKLTKAIKGRQKRTKNAFLKKALFCLNQNSKLIEKEISLKERVTKRIIKKAFTIIKSVYQNNQKIKTHLINILKQYSKKIKWKVFNKLIKNAKTSIIKQLISKSQNKVIYKFARGINNKVPPMLMKRYFWNSFILNLSKLKKIKEDNKLANTFYNMKIKVKYLSRYYEKFELKRRKRIGNEKVF